MGISRRRGIHDAGLVGREDTRYCVLCETLMIFERLDYDVSDDGVTEWVCVTCGSAVLVDPPTQGLGDDQQIA